MRQAGFETETLDALRRIKPLTPRLVACLELVDAHATSKEIAQQLGISPHTVDARMRRAITILGVRNRREAAMLWRSALEYQRKEMERSTGLPGRRCLNITNMARPRFQPTLARLPKKGKNM